MIRNEGIPAYSRQELADKRNGRIPLLDTIRQDVAVLDFSHPMYAADQTATETETEPETKPEPEPEPESDVLTPQEEEQAEMQLLRDAADADHPIQTSEEKEQMILLFFYGPAVQSSQVPDYCTTNYAPNLYKRLAKKGIRGVDAEEIIAATQLTALVYAERNPYITFRLLNLMFTNKRFDFLRKLYRQNEVELLDEFTNAGDSQDDIDVNTVLNFKVLETMKDDELQALMLLVHVGLNVGEIAKVMEKSYKAVESLLARVRQKYANEIAKLMLGQDEVPKQTIEAVVLYDFILHYDRIPTEY